MPPTERLWHTIDNFSGGGSSFTMLTYNILSDKYATPTMFGYVPTWFINWEYRKQLLVHEILSYDPDIICLQEVEASQYEQYFKPQFRMRGNYDGVFSPKSRARTMNEWDRTFVDGCAIFFKVDKFKFEDKQLIEFNQLALARPLLRKHKDMYNRVMTRDNISIMIRLEHKESRQELIIGNVHVHWDPSFCDVKLVQAIMLAEELEKISLRHPKAGLILCGDFNSLPTSGVHGFLEKGHIGPNHPDFLDHTYEPYSSEGASHGMNLRSAYGLLSDASSLTFTNYTSTFRGVIDYIYFRPGNLSVLGVLGGVPGEYERQVVGFPTQHYPSDHVSLLAEFRIENAGRRTTGYGGFSQSSNDLPDQNQRRLYSRYPNNNRGK